MKTSLILLLSGIAFTAAIPFSQHKKANPLKTSGYAVHNQQSALIIDTPDRDRFVKVDLVHGEFTEPTELAVLPNYDILVSQRRGDSFCTRTARRKLSMPASLMSIQRQTFRA